MSYESIAHTKYSGPPFDLSEFMRNESLDPHDPRRWGSYATPEGPQVTEKDSSSTPYFNISSIACGDLVVGQPEQGK